jgi:3-oxoacyl-[acyl-carrier-protein] synthase-3
LDLILVATMTPDYPTPSAACQVQRQLGATAPAMDLNAACAGFMYGLITGAQFVGNGCAAKVLVIGADVMTRTVDPLDVKTYPLFGDGAGAALLVPHADRSAGILGYSLGAEGDGGDLLCIPAGGSRRALCPEAWEGRLQYLKMDGRAVFKWAVRIIEDTTKEVLEGVGMEASDLQLAIFHQANQRIIEAAMSHLPVRRDQIFANLDKYGNTSAASIPLAIDEALAAGRIHSGDHVLLCGFGAGLAWGTAVLRW